MRIRNFFGRELGINPDAVVLEDGVRAVQSADLDIYGGSPLVLQKIGTDEDASYVSYSYLLAQGLTTNVRPWGVSKFNKNAYKDETYDQLAYNGSGKGTACTIGRVTLFANSFRQQDGTIVKQHAFVTTDAFVPGDRLFVNLEVVSGGVAGANFGKITRTLSAGVNDWTFIGYCSNFWASATEPCLEMVIERNANLSA